MASKWSGKQCPLCFDGTLHDPIFLSYPVATSGEIGGEMIGGDFFFGLAAMILSTI